MGTSIKFTRNNSLPITRSLTKVNAQVKSVEAGATTSETEEFTAVSNFKTQSVDVQEKNEKVEYDAVPAEDETHAVTTNAYQTHSSKSEVADVSMSHVAENNQPSARENTEKAPASKQTIMVKDEVVRPSTLENVIESPTALAEGLTYKLDVGLPPPPAGGYRVDQMGEILEKLGVSPSRVSFALAREKMTKEHLSQIMRDFNFLSAENVARALAIQANLEFFPIENMDKVDADSLNVFRSDMPIYQGFAPLYINGNKLVLAVADAANISTAANRFYEYKTTVVIASESTIQTVYRKFFSSTEGAFDVQLEKYNLINSSREQDLDSSPGLLRDLFGALLRHACTQKVSDIHMHMTEHVGLIKLTLDGISTIFRSIPADLYNRILTRLIADAGVKMEDLRNDMKEGTVEWNAADTELYRDIFSRYGFRLQLGAAKGGYSAVIRILDRNANASELAHLNFDDWTKKELQKVVNTSAGLMLITGPTGSGKTTTLYAILKEVDPVTRSIQTIEHPVEYRHGLWMQYEINRGTKSEGEEWGKMLKGLLRNAPKVILMGEVRDSDTAKTLIEAANTGHLVFTTLHTNTAAMAISRLKKLDVDMDSLAGELLGVMAQRLVRVLCQHCKVEDTSPDTAEEINLPENQDYLADYYPYKLMRANPRGCAKCSHTGFIGRKIVYEFLKMSPEVRSLIEKNAPTSEIARKGLKHGFSMWSCGLKLVAQGLTSLDALRTVAHKDTVDI